MAVLASAVDRVFPALEALTRTMVARHRGDRPQLDLEAFENLSDHLTIVRTARRFGDFRVSFFGSAAAEVTHRDLTGADFADLLDDPFYRSSLQAHRHASFTGLPVVTRNHAAPALDGYFTRMLIPIFAGNRAEFLVAAVVPHEAPFPGPAYPLTSRSLSR